MSLASRRNFAQLDASFVQNCAYRRKGKLMQILDNPKIARIDDVPRTSKNCNPKIARS